MKVYDEIECDVCWTVFTPKAPQAKYCCDECRYAAHKELAVKRFQKTKGKRVTDPIGKCVICGTEFKRKNGREKFCSFECRKTAERQRYKKYREAQNPPPQSNGCSKRCQTC